MTDKHPDDALYVRFYRRAVEDPDTTKVKGYKVWKDVDYIFIKIDAFNELDVPVRHSEKEDEYSDIRRFPKHWEAYQRQDKSQIVGIPLDKVPFLTPARVKNYAAQDIYTVEQLATLPDGRVQQLGLGTMDDRKAAREYIDVAKHNKAFEDLQRQIEQLKADRDTLKAALEAKQKGIK